MRFIDDCINGISTRELSSPDGFKFLFNSSSLPYGRRTSLKYISIDGISGKVNIKSRPKYDNPCDLCLDNIRIDGSHPLILSLIILIKSHSHFAPIRDGWHTSFTGYYNKQYFRNNYMIGLRKDCPELSDKLNFILDLIMKLSAQQVDAPEPATMIFSACQHHIGRPGDL